MKRQSGFTLVELMISSIIGLFLMASLINLFITTNKSISLSEALAQNQESGRFAMNYMSDFIREAGYSENAEISLFPILYNDPDTTAPQTTCISAACSSNNPDSDTVNGDRLSITYVASDTSPKKSCSGTEVGGAGNGEQRIANVFWVNNDSKVTNVNDLVCQTFNFGTNTWIDAAPVSIIENVDSFEFQLGIADKANSRDASRYVNMDTILDDATKVLNFDLIRSIRISLLTSSVNSLDKDKSKDRVQRVQANVKTRHYTILDGKTLTKTDGNIRQIFTNTIELPSMIEGAVFKEEGS